MNDSWRGALYPEDLPKRKWLPYYSTQFSTVEINSSFYRTRSLEAVRSWRTDTHRIISGSPGRHRNFITHWKRLSDKCDNSIALMQSIESAVSQDHRRAFPTAAAVCQKCRAAEFFSSAIAAAAALPL
jgi:uncharacterized protein YecE (DUF72 family)